MILVMSSVLFAAAPPPVVNGELTTDYPEVVLLYMVDKSGMAAGCTGSLIAPRWVLTASHCITDTRDFTISNVYVAFVNNSNEMDNDNSELAKAWYAHPDYSSTGAYNDIALVELRRDHEGPFMPVTDRGLAPHDEGTNFRVVGFGITSDNDQSQVSKKRTAEIPLDSYDSRLMYTVDKVDDKNACHGDSGGPMLRQYDDGSYAVAGVVDFSGDTRAGSCMTGGVYSARVDEFLPFIDDYTTDYTVYAEAEPEDTGTPEDTGSGAEDSGAGGGGADDGSGDASTTAEPLGLCGVTGAGTVGSLAAVAGLLASTGRRRR